MGGDINLNAISYDPGLVTTNLFGFGSEWNRTWTPVKMKLPNSVQIGKAVRSTIAIGASGVGQFGYGNNGEQLGGTTVEFGGVEDDKHITTYFRKTFNVPAGDYVSATLNLIRDDGVVVYLDGEEIGRNNFDHLPANEAIEFNDLAEDAIGGSDESTPISFSIDLDLIEAGNHTLAIEVHQANIDSSDLSFDAELELSTQSSGSGPLVLNSSTNIKARAFSNGEWSAISDAAFVVAGSAAPVSPISALARSIITRSDPTFS